MVALDSPGLGFIQALLGDCHDLLQNVIDVLFPGLSLAIILLLLLLLLLCVRVHWRLLHPIAHSILLTFHYQTHSKSLQRTPHSQSQPNGTLTCFLMFERKSQMKIITHSNTRRQWYDDHKIHRLALIYGLGAALAGQWRSLFSSHSRPTALRRVSRLHDARATYTENQHVDLERILEL